MPVIGDYILSSELSWHFCKTTTTTTTTIIHNCPFGCGCISGFLTMSLSDLSVLSSVPYCFVFYLFTENIKLCSMSFNFIFLS